VFLVTKCLIAIVGFSVVYEGCLGRRCAAWPAIAAKMGGSENGNHEATEPLLPDPVEEHKAQALEGLLNLTQQLDLLTPEARWRVVQQLDKARADAVRLGVKEPEPADF
jgi:hypothetical protein